MGRGGVSDNEATLHGDKNTGDFRTCFGMTQTVSASFSRFLEVLGEELLDTVGVYVFRKASSTVRSRRFREAMSPVDLRFRFPAGEIEVSNESSRFGANPLTRSLNSSSKSLRKHCIHWR